MRKPTHTQLVIHNFIVESMNIVLSAGDRQSRQIIADKKQAELNELKELLKNKMKASQLLELLREE